MARIRIIHLKAGMSLDERYKLQAPLGHGSMAEVWSALDEKLQHPVAVKVVAEILAPSQQARARFEREMHAIGSIQHPNVVSLLGHGELEDGRPYLVMELMEGRTLASYLEEHPRLGVYSAVMLARQILDGLAAAHVRGIIHRDLKPANIFLAQRRSGRRRVKILDFGVAFVLDVAEDPAARLTRTGTVLGSPRYMPREVARGSEELDERADLFGVGAVTYHALAGRPPFEGRGIGEIMQKILSHDIPPLPEDRVDISPALRACVERALADQPEDRYPSAREMLAALEPILADLRPGRHEP